jgi:hypothetical protein
MFDFTIQHSCHGLMLESSWSNHNRLGSLESEMADAAETDLLLQYLALLFGRQPVFEPSLVQGGVTHLFTFALQSHSAVLRSYGIPYACDSDCTACVRHIALAVRVV